MRWLPLSWLLPGALSLVACDGAERRREPPPARGATSAASLPAPAVNEAGLEEVSLAPLPLVLEVVPGGLGALDTTLDVGKESVTVDVGGKVSLRVASDPRPLAQVMRDEQADPVFPFKKWAHTEATAAVLQFDDRGAPRFRGFAVREVSGKRYLCKTAGPHGVPTEASALSAVRLCDGLIAR